MILLNSIASGLSVWPVLGIIVLAYLLGSINFSIIITKSIKHDDIRNYGSGNAGMTNVMRTLGKKPAYLTFLLDFLKCVVAVAVAWGIGSACGYSHETVSVLRYIAGFFCVMGHMFPVFYGFRGGKGVVTSIAMMLLCDIRSFVLVGLIFIVILMVKKIVSLGSIISMGVLFPLSTFIMAYLFDYSGSPLSTHGSAGGTYVAIVTLIAAATGLAIILKHSSNIKRLIAGEEKPMHLKNHN